MKTLTESNLSEHAAAILAEEGISYEFATHCRCFDCNRESPLGSESLQGTSKAIQVARLDCHRSKLHTEELMSYPFPEEEITITRGELERLIEAGFNRGFVKECDRNEGSARSVGMSMLNKAISGGFTSDDFAKFAAQFESNS